ncbi:MAG TPA: hypothetical protein PKV44_07345 [Bacillota bacterium]|nr:hypothetical protein [Bacillota bacterium]HPE38159.1 hypothetical protein [Bacillota bacterium]
MDYLEGLLLGKLWSDTDFENRRHTSLFFLYGLFVSVLVLYNYWTGALSGFISGYVVLKVVLLMVLFFLSPVICFAYYRLPLWGKIPLLIVQFTKSMLITLLVTAWMRPKLTVGVPDLKTWLVDYLNKTLEHFTSKYVETAGTFATVLGVISGGIYLVFLAAVILFAAVILPGLVYIVIRLLQYGYDKLIRMLVMSDVVDK